MAKPCTQPNLSPSALMLAIVAVMAAPAATLLLPAWLTPEWV